MKKGCLSLLGVVLMVLLMTSCGCTKPNTGEEAKETFPVQKETYTQVAQADKEASGGYFPVYTDKGSPDNHYIPSGWMGDINDIKVDQAWMENPHSGTTCIQVIYTGEGSNGARWAGIYWQNPPNNWGDKDGGYNLEGAEKLTFWARGAEGGERIEEFKVGGITGKYADSDTAGIGPVVLTKDWKQYTIDLKGKDLSYIIGGFAFATNVDVNPYGCIFYIDDLRYEFGPDEEDVF